MHIVRTHTFSPSPSKCFNLFAKKNHSPYNGSVVPSPKFIKLASWVVYQIHIDIQRERVRRILCLNFIVAIAKNTKPCRHTKEYKKARNETIYSERKSLKYWLQFCCTLLVCFFISACPLSRTSIFYWLAIFFLYIDIDINYIQPWSVHENPFHLTKSINDSNNRKMTMK